MSGARYLSTVRNVLLRMSNDMKHSNKPFIKEYKKLIKKKGFFWRFCDDFLNKTLNKFSKGLIWNFGLNKPKKCH